MRHESTSNSENVTRTGAPLTVTWRARWSIVTGPTDTTPSTTRPWARRRTARMRLRRSARPDRFRTWAAAPGEPKRLRDVVVGAGLEALDDVGLAVERGEHDDRHDRAPGAQGAGDVVAGRPGAERDVEQHDVEVLLGRAGERRLPVGHGGDPVALPLEGPGEHVAQRLVVVDDQDVQRGVALHARWTVAAGGRPTRRRAERLGSAPWPWFASRPSSAARGRTRSSRSRSPSPRSSAACARPSS